MKALLFLLLSALSVSAQEASSHFSKGAEHFFAGRIKESLVEWDAQVKEDPSSLAAHWQRGLALYYAERYKEGRAQFERDQYRPRGAVSGDVHLELMADGGWLERSGDRENLLGHHLRASP